MSTNFTRNLPAAALVAAVFGFPTESAAAPTAHYLNIAATSFMGHDSSFHNDGNAPDACAAPVALAIGEENRGDLQNAAGSFIAAAVLPEGSTVTKFTLFANDNDGDINSRAYLMRKRIAGGLTPAKSGITVMATASTSGAVADTLRAFTDTTIGAPKISNSQYEYYVELVNCGKTVEPFAVQIVATTP